MTMGDDTNLQSAELSASMPKKIESNLQAYIPSVRVPPATTQITAEHPFKHFLSPDLFCRGIIHTSNPLVNYPESFCTAA